MILGRIEYWKVIILSPNIDISDLNLMVIIKNFTFNYQLPSGPLKRGAPWSQPWLHGDSILPVVLCCTTTLLRYTRQQLNTKMYRKNDTRCCDTK
jgi:hypothetical protein